MWKVFGRVSDTVDERRDEEMRKKSGCLYMVWGEGAGGRVREEGRGGGSFMSGDFGGLFKWTRGWG